MAKISPHRTRKMWQPLNRRSQLLATLGVLAMSQIYSFHFKPSAILKAEPACITASCLTRSPFQAAFKHTLGN